MQQRTPPSHSVLGHRAPGPRLTPFGAALIVLGLSLPFWVVLAFVAIVRG
ncbi:hypothetical protein JQU17_02220 [Ponticoccus sp. SC2-23]|nr:hypothetical protein [Alexandriicola marinus]MBM1219000.1 hypothetical protein [Ponticoccus sp. SC6-9]MBM1223928.1 hypothetical protein [Ponticoccus sp. SC6-15]MBM1230293.1 hypothetical protein [Ponticoccus sp. SC6-38]MBM1232894.1 hypothetical protein [Ponticoccus sp. SC6-45]MBM1237156.1 hypothetical protein [Ponticoccus sp. SC6-49]MBM1241905.1 hypothetical protein [Ponticoccus sp. SC2-64]MBM1246418.1 hypothetical protein [Ponticoccus sp. SC6-42]MBM1250896.1 hypothetical protein [Pontico